MLIDRELFVFGSISRPRSSHMGKFIDELCNVLAFIDSNYQAKSVYIHVWRYEHYFVFIVQMLTYTDLCELASPLWLDTFASMSHG